MLSLKDKWKLSRRHRGAGELGAEGKRAAVRVGDLDRRL